MILEDIKYNLNILSLAYVAIIAAATINGLLAHFINVLVYLFAKRHTRVIWEAQQRERWSFGM